MLLPAHLCSVSLRQTVPQEGSYAELLTTAIRDLLHANNPGQLQAAGSQLERAALAVPTDWLPRYYQAYGYVVQCFTSQEADAVKDNYLDRAEVALVQARQRGGDPAELLVLQAYIYQGRLSISPLYRSVRYLALMRETLTQAKQANPANPRIYLLEGNNVYFTPKLLGGGPAAAKKLFEEAKRRFGAFHPSQPLAPNWGETQVDRRLQALTARVPVH